MRIGILTFHRGVNYGGILQCYALQKVLSKYGHEVEVIDYAPSSLSQLRRMYNKLKTLNSFQALWNVVKLRVFGRKPGSISKADDITLLCSRFDDFRRNNIRISPKLTSTTIGQYANDHYDAIVVGSDQVWTSLYDSSSTYFLGWLPEFRGKRISYAACSAHSFVRGHRRVELANLLKKFSLVTVRDNTTASLVENITGERPQIVPDPTMLHNFKEFLIENDSKGEYILTYILGSEIEGGHEQALARIKSQIGNISVYSIVSKTDNITPYSEQVFRNTSPEEWIRLIAGAKAVYTDSFHAILFSMKFGIPFAAYWCDVVRSSRLIFLRDKYKLPNIVSSAKAINLSVRHQPTVEDDVLCNM